MNTEHVRTINTNFYGDYAIEILDAVSGQLSDGLWENSRGYDKYWTNFRVKRQPDNRIVFIINTDSYTMYCHRYLENPFVRMSETEFLTWYAGKLKRVINEEAHNKDWKKGWWKRDNTTNKSIYLNHKLDITVADIYCVYDGLLSRRHRSSDETNERIFGTARSAEETEAEVKRHEIKAKIDAAYEKRGEEIRNWRTEAIKKLEAEYLAKTTASYYQWRAELKEAGLLDS